MPDWIGSRFHGNFDVISKPAQTFHKFALRQVCEIASKQRGYFRLRKSHEMASLFLRQIKSAFRFRNLDDKTGFYFQLLSICKPKIRKYIAGTAFDLNAVNDARCQCLSPLQESPQP